MSGGKWNSFVGSVYYFSGASYYIYSWYIALGVAGLSFSGFLAYFYHASVTLGGTLLIVLAVGLVVWGISSRLQMEKHRLRDGNPGLRILQITSNYIVRPTEHTSTRTIRARALHAVESYNHKFRWTGQGEIFAEAVDPDIKVSLQKDRLYAGQWCRLDFERPLLKGKTREFSWRLIMRNVTERPKPFFSQRAMFDIDKMTLEVVFDPPLHLRSARKEILLSDSSDYPIWEDTVSVRESTGVLDWVITHPRVGCMYRLTWVEMEATVPKSVT